MQYRDFLIQYFLDHKKQPDFFPKNINFNLFLHILPMIHQVVIYNWLGSLKLRPVIIDKINRDPFTINVSEYEKYLSVFLYSDIKGIDYPEIVNKFVKNSTHNYVQDISFLKILSYYHLRNNTKDLDDFYLKLMSEIQENLGHIPKKQKSQFMQSIKEKKKKKR